MLCAFGLSCDEACELSYLLEALVAYRGSLCGSVFLDSIGLSGVVVATLYEEVHLSLLLAEHIVGRVLKGCSLALEFLDEGVGFLSPVFGVLLLKSCVVEEELVVCLFRSCQHRFHRRPQ